MTTKISKFLDNKICTFKTLLSWRVPRRTAFWTIFLSAPKASPPQKSENCIFIVVSPSLIGDKRQSAVFCGFLRIQSLRFSARSCASQILSFLGEGESQQKSARISAKISENQRKIRVWARFVPSSLSP